MMDNFVWSLDGPGLEHRWYGSYGSSQIENYNGHLTVHLVRTTEITEDTEQLCDGNVSEHSW